MPHAARADVPALLLGLSFNLYRLKLSMPFLSMSTELANFVSIRIVSISCYVCGI